MAELHLSFQSVSSWWSSEDNLDWCHWNYRTEISHATQTKKEVWLATRKECNDWSDAFLGLAGKTILEKDRLKCWVSHSAWLNYIAQKKGLSFIKDIISIATIHKEMKVFPCAATLLQLFTYFQDSEHGQVGVVLYFKCQETWFCLILLPIFGITQNLKWSILSLIPMDNIV